MQRRVAGKQGFMFRYEDDKKCARFAGGEVLTNLQPPDKSGIVRCDMHDQYGTRPIEVTELAMDIQDYPELFVVKDGAVTRYVFSVTRAFSRLLNAAVGGWSGETLSGRAYREDVSWLRYILDTAWYYLDSEVSHCRDCYLLDASHEDYSEPLENGLKIPRSGRTCDNNEGDCSNVSSAEEERERRTT